MATPKQKHTQSRKNKRRSNVNIKTPELIHCPKCGKSVLPYTACRYCGYYKGREIINVLAKLKRKEKKKRKKEMAAHQKEEKKEKPLTMEELSRKS